MKRYYYAARGDSTPIYEKTDEDWALLEELKQGKLLTADTFNMRAQDIGSGLRANAIQWTESNEN